MRFVSYLPTLNAALNSVSAALLAAGYVAIRRKRIPLHRAWMVSAFAVSALFLVSYVIYHAEAGSRPFQGRGWIRPVYFAILITHVVLAAAIVPMALCTLARALGGRFEAHRRIARWTWPVWMYVSVTGVAIYLLLYGAGGVW
jgi:putative membrane protein